MSVRQAKTDGAYPQFLNLGTVLSFIAFVVLGLLLFHNVLDNFFLSDDFNLIRNVKEHGPFAIWTWGGAFWRPIISLSLFADYNLWKLNPTGYHLSNVFLHSVNSWLVALICYRILSCFGKLPHWSDRSRILTAYGAGLLFLAMPCHTEAVSWISGRTDVIAAFFCLTALYFYLRFRSDRRISEIILSLLCYLAALASKESSLTLGLIIPILDIFLTATENREPPGYLPTAGAAFLYIALIPIYLMVRYFFLGTVTGGYGSEMAFFLNADKFIKAIGHYTTKIIFPLPTTLAASSLAGIGRIVGICVLLAAVSTCVALVGACLGSSSRRRAADHAAILLGGVLILAFAIAQLPGLAYGVSLTDTQGDRFLYWPSSFYAMLLALVGSMLVRNRKYFIAPVLGLLLLFAGTLHTLNDNWRQAGQITSEALHDIESRGVSGRMLIMNIPDTFRGAYVFRNGLGEAVALFLPATQQVDPAVISFQDCKNMREPISAYRLDRQAALKLDSWNFSINGEPSAHHGCNAPVEIGSMTCFSTGLYQVCLTKDPGFTVSCEPEFLDNAMYYADGRLKPVCPNDTHYSSNSISPQPSVYAGEIASSRKPSPRTRR